MPLNLLPPSRGMKLMRTPPVAACASTAETSIANSAVPPRSAPRRRPTRRRSGAERHAVDHHALVAGSAAVGHERRDFRDDCTADVTARRRPA
jgi:hypothetical protein